MSSGRKLISVVTSAYNEEECIEELCHRLQAVFAENKKYDFEVILIENGAQDGQFAKMLAVHQQDPRFKILQFSRNFRMDGGVTGGLKYAKGDAAVIMAADLQDPPEIITEFIKKWEEGYDNIYQVVTKRATTSLFRRMAAQVFYFVANRMTGGMIPRNVSDFRLVDRKVYETINRMEERNRFVRGLFAWVGFKSIGVECERLPRFAGETRAETLKLFDLAFKGLLVHSYMPLKAIMMLGLAISSFSFLMLLYVVYRVLRFGVPYDGYGTMVCLMLLLFGFLFTMLGVIGEYIGLIYEEVKQRPNFIVKREIGF